MIVAMTEMLGDHDATIRAVAVRSLCEASASDPASGLAPASVALVDDDAGVRAAAVEGLGQLISQAVKNGSGESDVRAAAPKLLAALKDPRADVRNAAIQALIAINTTRICPSARPAENGSQSIHPLIDAGATVAALTELLGDPDAAVRVSAVKALGQSEPSAISEGVVPHLVSALKNSDSDVRYEVIRVLSRLGSKATAAIPAFIAALNESADTDRAKVAAGAPVLGNSVTGPAYVAAEALGKIAPGTSFASKAVAGLTEVVASGPPGRRPVAANALGQFGSQAATAVPALAKMLRETSGADEASDEGSSAADALGRIAPGTPSAALASTALTEALDSKSAETRGAAAKALKRFGPGTRPGGP